MESLPPLQLPPTPPELLAGQEPTSWRARMTRWVEELIRVLGDVWRKATTVINAISARITTAEGRITTLEARAKDIYTFTTVGNLAVGVNVTQVKLVARVAGTLTEAFAYVGTAPTGTKLILDVNKNGTTIFSGTKLEIAIAAQTGTQAGFTSAALVPGDVLSIDVDQVGSVTPGADLTVHLVAK